MRYTFIHSIDAYELKVHEKNPPPLSDEANVHSIHSTMGSASAALSFITGKNRAAERMLESVIREVHPDWVHHHNISLLGISMMDIAKCPQIYTAHDHWLVCQRNDLMYCGRYACTSNKCFSCSLKSKRPPQTWRSSLPDHLKRMSIVIAPSNYLAAVLKERMEIEPVILPNFVPRPTMPNDIDMPPHFVYVGVLEKHKGLAPLLDAFKEADLDVELHILGRGSMARDVKRFEISTDGKVVGLGHLGRDGVISEVASAIALIAPSICQENSPLSCIEALALGVPLIVSSQWRIAGDGLR